MLTEKGNDNYDRINSDKLAPPGTDSGSTINAQWPMGTSIPFDLTDLRTDRSQASVITGQP